MQLTESGLENHILGCFRRTPLRGREEALGAEGEWKRGRERKRSKRPKKEKERKRISLTRSLVTFFFTSFSASAASRKCSFLCDSLLLHSHAESTHACRNDGYSSSCERAAPRRHRKGSSIDNGICGDRGDDVYHSFVRLLPPRSRASGLCDGAQMRWGSFLELLTL